MSLFVKPLCAATAFVMLSLLGQNSLAGSCDSYTDCSLCASDASCMWALLYNCTERCIEQSYSDLDGIMARDVIWRSAVRNETQCARKEWCEIIVGDVPNPSFEDWSWLKFNKKEREKNGVDGKTIHDPWVFARTIAVKNSSMVTVSMKEIPFYWALDGSFFLFMGRSTVYETKTFEVRLDNTLRISESATHLSFFYALPYYSKAFLDYTQMTFTSFINRTALDVYIDGEHVLHMYNENINNTVYRGTNAFYHPMNIDVTRFADGKNHSLTLYFTRPTDPSSSAETKGTQEQLMLIDYIQIIKSNRKYVSLFLALGNTIFQFTCSEREHV